MSKIGLFDTFCRAITVGVGFRQNVSNNPIFDTLGVLDHFCDSSPSVCTGLSISALRFGSLRGLMLKFCLYPGVNSGSDVLSLP